SLPKSVVTSGFGWSGTGAVNDYISSGNNITFPFGKAESAFFLGKKGMPGLRHTTAENLPDFFLNTVIKYDYRSVLPHCVGREETFSSFVSACEQLGVRLGNVRDLSPDQKTDGFYIKKLL